VPDWACVEGQSRRPQPRNIGKKLFSCEILRLPGRRHFIGMGEITREGNP
jgi:hypothetical protein